MVTLFRLVQRSAQCLNKFNLKKIDINQYITKK
jgi:hypothetical protein